MTSWKVNAGRVFIDVEAAGLLKALAHDRTFSAPAPNFEVTADADAQTLDVPVAFAFPAEALVPDAEGLSKREYRQMLDNLRGRDVLDTQRHPEISFAGTYRGNWQAGVLEGALTLRGKPQALELAVTVVRTGNDVRVEGEWTGTLAALGIKPFTAMLGTIKLKEYARVGFEVAFRGG